MAMPCTRGVSAIRPTIFLVAVSMTTTSVPWVTYRALRRAVDGKVVERPAPPIGNLGYLRVLPLPEHACAACPQTNTDENADQETPSHDCRLFVCGDASAVVASSVCHKT